MIARATVVFTLGVLAMAAWTRAADAPAGLTVDKENKAVIIDAKVAPRKLARYEQIYPIEVIASWPDEKKGQKAHETIVTFEALPSDIHKALEELGLKPGKPVKGEGQPTGPELRVLLEVPTSTGGKRRIPIERTLIDKRTNLTMPALKFYFTGSAMTQLDPNKPDLSYGADKTGTLITVFPVSDETVIQTSLSIKDEPLLKLETDRRVLPEEGTPVKLILQAK